MMGGGTILVIGHNHHMPREMLLALTRLDVVLTVVPDKEFRRLSLTLDSAFQPEPLGAEVPKQITHGPLKKGRGGKIRRW